MLQKQSIVARSGGTRTSCQHVADKHYNAPSGRTFATQICGLACESLALFSKHSRPHVVTFKHEVNEGTFDHIAKKTKIKAKAGCVAVTASLALTAAHFKFRNLHQRNKLEAPGFSLATACRNPAARRTVQCGTGSIVHYSSMVR